MGLSVPVAEKGDLRPAASLRVAFRPCRGVMRVGLPPGNGTRELRVHDVCGRLTARASVPAVSRRPALSLGDLQPGVCQVSAAGTGAVPVAVVR